MKPFKILFLILVVMVIVIISADPAVAQCAMCKATGESTANEGTGYAEGLNKGILYLMTIPYLTFGVIGFFWYRNSKRDSKQQGRISGIIQKRLGSSLK